MVGESIRQVVVDFLIRDRATAQITEANTAINGFERESVSAKDAAEELGTAGGVAAGGVGKTGDSAKDAAKKANEFRDSLLALGTALSAAGVGGYLYFDTMAKGYSQYASTYQTFTRNAGEDADQLLASMQVATRGMVASSDLVLAANRAMAMGIDQEALPRLAEIAEAAGRIMGTDTTQMFDDIVGGIARQEKEILDNLGIVVSATEANEMYAQSIGKSAAALTSEERQTAMLYAVMEKGQPLIDMAGEGTDNLTTASARASVALGQLNMAMGEAAEGPMMAWYNLLGNAAGTVANLPQPILTVAAGVGMLGSTVAGVTGPVMLQAAALMFLKNQWFEFRTGLATMPAVSAIAAGGLSGLTAGLYGVAAAAWAALTPLLPFVALALGIGAVAGLADISAHGWDNSFIGQMFGAGNPTTVTIPSGTPQSISVLSSPTQNIEINGIGMSKDEIEELLATEREKMLRESDETLKRGLSAYQ